MAAPNPAGHTLISATNQIATSAAKITIYGCSTRPQFSGHVRDDLDVVVLCEAEWQRERYLVDALKSSVGVQYIG